MTPAACIDQHRLTSWWTGILKIPGVSAPVRTDRSIWLLKKLSNNDCLCTINSARRCRATKLDRTSSSCVQESHWKQSAKKSRYYKNGQKFTAGQRCAEAIQGAGSPKQTFFRPEQCRMLQNQTEVILKLSRSCVNHGQKPGKIRQGATKMDRKGAVQDGKSVW